MGAASEDQGRHHHLGDGEAVGPASEQAQTFRAEFEADGKEQEHHAEFGQRLGFLGAADETQHRRPDHHARREVSQHLSEPQPLKQRDENEQRHQKDQHFMQVGLFVHRRPDALPDDTVPGAKAGHH